jgi:uncharacterized protein (TIGR02145 family)
MKNVRKSISALLIIAFAVFGCQPEAPNPVGSSTPPPDTTNSTPPPPGEGNPTNPNTPFTTIPDELVGTWYAENNSNPMTTNWEQGTFQGEESLREYRTMVFTKDGKNAIEYTSQVYKNTDEVKQIMFKRVGTLEYKTNPTSLTFHVQSGRVRYFSSSYTGYKESDLVSAEWPTYLSVLVNPEATTYSNATNYLTAQRSNGAGQYSVKYTKADGSKPTNPTPDPGSLYSTPPATGTYIQIADKYYPTVTIGEQEWMAVNYAGTGGMKDSQKAHYGTFYKFMDIKDIPVPAGWRIPNKQDYIKLLQSQNLVLTPWESTDGADLASKKMLGQLMATSGWLKQDGYATNKSGFNAVPANYKAQDAKPNGEGTRCFLWTSEIDASENPIAFQIVQLSGETYASFLALPMGYSPQHVPVRLVRDK